MTERSSNELLKASRLLQKLVHRSTELKLVLTLDREQEELFKQLDAGLRRVERLVSKASGEDFARKGPAEIWIVISKTFIRAIEILSKFFYNSSLFCKSIRCCE